MSKANWLERTVGLVEISRREREALKPVVVFGWTIEFRNTEHGLWDGDTTLPFRAHKTLSLLCDKRLMEAVLSPPGWKVYRATKVAREYLCRKESCFQGRTLDDDGVEIGRCQDCDGTGLMLMPNASLTGGSAATEKHDE